MRDALRIVHIVNNLAIGGAERVALNLALEQLRAGHEPHIYCIDGEGGLAAEAREAGVCITDFAKGPGFSARVIAAIAMSLRRAKPHVVHTHNPSAHYYGAVAAFLSRVPLVVNTRHSPVMSQQKAYGERYYRWLLRITDGVVFVSEHARRVVEAQWRNTRTLTYVIPNGIPVSAFRSQPARPGAARPRIVFGTMGRLTPVKGHSLLISAFRRVADQAPEAELRIVGGGSLETALREDAARLGLSDRVHIFPPTSRVAEVLSGFDVFVISSLSEGLPMVVLEAMAAGLPIVSTCVGGIPEAVPEGQVGWFCKPGDAESLAEAMLAAFHSGDLAERGRSAAELVVGRYDAKRMASEYEQLFGRLLCRSGSVS